jgi:hypothetical protein
VSTVRRHDSLKYLVVVIVVDEVVCHMTTMAVKNKEVPISLAVGLLLCAAVKNLLQPY